MTAPLGRFVKVLALGDELIILFSGSFHLLLFSLFLPLLTCPGCERQARGVLHRWAYCSSRAKDGPCRCHHCWWKRRRQRENCCPAVSWSCGQHVPCPAGQHNVQGESFLKIHTFLFMECMSLRG